MTIDVQKENWLAKIGEMKPPETYIHLSNLGGLTIEKARSAIAATYGHDYATLHDHGTVFWGTHLANLRINRAAKDQPHA